MTAVFFMKTQKSSNFSSASYGVDAHESNQISALLDGFFDYALYELNFSPQTIIKYRDSLNWVIRDIGDKDVEKIEMQDIVTLKKKMIERGVGDARKASIVYSLRSFFAYCRDFHKLKTLSPKKIRPPKRKRREVIFLTKEEIDAFIETIDVKKWNGLRFRALVEVLLGTGMRIGEVLSLNRNDILWRKKEAKIIGKGDKERRVFFTQKSINWLRRYLESRHDHHDALFITRKPIGRLNRDDVSRFFCRHRKLARIDKKLTPHILRHTVATNLVFNGCPIVHVKEILGHDRLDTTCKYYLGVDKAKAKKAHREFLNFND